MANNLTNFTETELLKWLLNLTPAYTPGATKLALYTVTPGEAGGGTEVSGGSYVRQSITWGAVTSGTVSNSADITFPSATADWGTITGIGIWDNGGTNMLWYGPLTAAKTIATGEIFKVLSANLTVSLD
ncbi:phage tail fiber protein [Candidatus Solirubrobacter pratensis]|uniref:phage tail fiber protein n=1 Tax=Candidatus Solirubrobacter pratensis TaxID=1298857 RepID=UPI000424DCBD|nr:hypothetical protein [Candidatus Solirubrobacter pratensis]